MELTEGMPEVVPEDQPPAGPDATRRELLEDVRRPFAPIRHVFVQLPRGSDTRASTLAGLVSGRNGRALDALLLLYALQPILSGTPLPAAAWARSLSHESGPRVSSAAVSRLWHILEQAKLLERGPRIHRHATVQPLLEDGSGQHYEQPGATAAGTTGYFILPHDYWLSGWDRALSLAGKAMLLVHLSGTQVNPTLAMSYEQALPWYGIGERTAERGIRELRRHGLLGEHAQRVTEPRSPEGWTWRHHRYLHKPFSLQHRHTLQKAARAAVRAKQRASASNKSA